MRNGLNRIFGENPDEQGLVAEIADDQVGPLRHVPAIAGRQIIDDDDRLALVEKSENHMAANVSGAARNQDCHCVSLLRLSAEIAVPPLRAHYFCGSAPVFRLVFSAMISKKTMTGLAGVDQAGPPLSKFCPPFRNP